MEYLILATIRIGGRVRHREAPGLRAVVLDRLETTDASRLVLQLGDVAAAVRWCLGEVRRLAREAGLANHAKKDSTGICFIGERRFRDFLARYLPASPGRIQTDAGQTIGHHDGLMYYTLGQRQGLGIGGVANSADEPWYVVGKDLQNNVLIVAQGHDHPLLLRTELVAREVHWISGEAPQDMHQLSARCRHRQPLQRCAAAIVDNRLHVQFDQAQRALTPGQSVVLYDGEVCLGGGIID